MRYCIFVSTLENCFQWIPFKNFVVACRNPTNIELNSEGELHAIDKPAVGFADGWGIYCLNGEVKESYECTKLGQILYT